MKNDAIYINTPQNLYKDLWWKKSENKNQWRDVPCSQVGRLTIVKKKKKVCFPIWAKDSAQSQQVILGQLLPNQVPFAGHAANQNTGTPRFAAKGGFTYRAAKQEDGRTNLMSTSPKGLGCLWD